MQTGVATIISVDDQLCRRDGICSQICPSMVFSGDKDELPRIGDVTLCNLCGQCLAVCPSGAITHSRLDHSRFDRIEDRTPVGCDAAEYRCRNRQVRVGESRDAALLRIGE